MTRVENKVVMPETQEMVKDKQHRDRLQPRRACSDTDIQNTAQGRLSTHTPVHKVVASLLVHPTRSRGEGGTVRGPYLGPTQHPEQQMMSLQRTMRMKQACGPQAPRTAVGTW